MTEESDRISHINHVHIEGYKSIDNLDIDLLKGLNILIGENGSGKSNFLDVVHSSFSKSFKTGPRKIGVFIETHRGTPILWEYENKSTITNDSLNLNATVSLSVSNKLISNQQSFPPNETQWDNTILFFEKLGIKYKPVQKIGFQLPKELSGNLTYRVVVNRLDYGQPNNFLWTEMENLLILIRGQENIDREIVLKNLYFKTPLKESLCRYSPITDIRFSSNLNIHSDGRTTSIENLYPEFKISNNWVPWSYLSDGTKRLFYLIYSVCQFERAIVLIDEPELGVHPHQFQQIMAFLKEESANKQIIIATHAPEALNILGHDELDRVIITEYSPKKGTTMRHLSAAQKKKAIAYATEVGYLSDYWLYSDLEK